MATQPNKTHLSTSTLPPRCRPVGACLPTSVGAMSTASAGSSDSVVAQVVPLGTQWPTLDPFLFCAHHLDAYPKANATLGPAAALTGRSIGSDFGGIDGWNMYHGETIPGFPQHPHRGFETVTYVRRGWCDHADSLGARARFGEGDVQWLTAGSGIVHSEMFPLFRTEADNPLHLFQIWLNLPAANKMVDPYFSMLWNAELPVISGGTGVEVTVIAGAIDDQMAPSPPPDSWAANPDAAVAIWHMPACSRRRVDAATCAGRREPGVVCLRRRIPSDR